MDILRRLFSISRRYSLLGVFGMMILAGTTALAQDDTDNSGEAVALFNEAQDAHEKGDLKKAIELYEKALEIAPEFPEAELQRGTAYLSLRRLDDAENAFRNAVKLREEWTLALSNLGSVLVTRGKFDEAKPYLIKAIELDPMSFPAYAAQTELLLRSTAPPAELKAFLVKLTALTTKPRAPASIWAARAAIEKTLGDRASAAKSAAKAVEIDPKNKFALAELGESALAEGDLEKASTAAAALSKLFPADEEPQLLRARIFLSQGKDEEAMAVLNNIATPSQTVLTLRDKIRSATTTDVAELEKELAADPKDPAKLGRLCGLYRVKDPQKALDLCRRAVEAEPDNIAHAVGYGAALVQAKQFAGAVQVLTKLKPLAPDNRTLRANLALAYFQLKMYAPARDEYRWLTEIQPDAPIAYYFLAITHDQLGEYPDAMVNYQQFLKLADPNISGLEIDKVKLRLPILDKQIKDKKGKKRNE